MNTDNILEPVDQRKAHYLADWTRIPMNGDPGWLAQLRTRHQDLFRHTGYPTPQMEEWRHTNIAPILDTPYRSIVAQTQDERSSANADPPLYNQPGWSELVFVDGHFNAALSRRPVLPPAVFVGGIHEALSGAEAPVLETNLGRHLKQHNAFTELNATFLLDGAFVHVPKNTRLESPIHLVFVSSTHADRTAVHPRVLILLERDAQASIVINFVGTQESPGYLNNVVEEIVLRENAQLDYVKVVQENPAGALLDTTEIIHARDSRLRAFTATLSGKIVRNQVNVTLDGEGAECHLSGLYLNDGQRLLDNMIGVNHAKPHGTSRIAYKGILDGESKAVFLGKVYVHTDAQKTDSRQVNRNLLLSERAAIETKPQLEIYADDVKCTHGATAGPFPSELLFYFRSRGISEAAARGMLTCGFAGEVLEDLPNDRVRRQIHQYVFEKYAPAKVR